jgi:hypothetical protein
MIFLPYGTIVYGERVHQCDVAYYKLHGPKTKMIATKLGGSALHNSVKLFQFHQLCVAKWVIEGLVITHQNIKCGVQTITKGTKLQFKHTSNFSSKVVANKKHLQLASVSSKRDDANLGTLEIVGVFSLVLQVGFINVFSWIFASHSSRMMF